MHSKASSKRLVFEVYAYVCTKRGNGRLTFLECLSEQLLASSRFCTPVLYILKIQVAKGCARLETPTEIQSLHSLYS